MFLLQEVIRNMMINKVDFRSEDDASIKLYCHQRTVETCVVPVSQEAKFIKQQLLNLMHPLAMAINTKCQVCCSSWQCEFKQLIAMMANRQWNMAHGS